jgi:hypothetical protein
MPRLGWVVEQLTHNPKIKGSNPPTFTRKEKNGGKARNASHTKQ